jgi:hypothetical protein
MKSSAAQQPRVRSRPARSDLLATFMGGDDRRWVPEAGAVASARLDLPGALRSLPCQAAGLAGSATWSAGPWASGDRPLIAISVAAGQRGVPWLAPNRLPYCVRLNQAKRKIADTETGQAEQQQGRKPSWSGNLRIGNKAIPIDPVSWRGGVRRPSRRAAGAAMPSGSAQSRAHGSDRG